MDFFQVVDSALNTRGVFFVVCELLLAFVVAILSGIALLHVPRLLIGSPQTSKPRKAATTKQTTGVVERKPAVVQKPPATATRPPQPPPQPATSIPSAQPSATATTSVPAAPAAARDEDGEVDLLDDVLDDFFEEDKLLDEALLDATAPVSEKGTEPHRSKGVASATLTSRGAPTAEDRKKDAHIPKPKTSDSGTTLDKEIARRMTKELQPKNTPSSTNPAAKSTTPTVVAEDQDLDKLLDVFMEEEEILEEAIIDSALAETKR